MSELKKSVVKVKVHNKEYLCDTAIDDWEREHGFMHIESLSENQGLLFISRSTRRSKLLDERYTFIFRYSLHLSRI